MRENDGGKIVFVSSVEVALGVAVHTHYDASKAALIGLTRSLARAVGKKRRVRQLHHAGRSADRKRTAPISQSGRSRARLGGAPMLAASPDAGRHRAGLRVLVQRRIGLHHRPGDLRRSRTGVLVKENVSGEVAASTRTRGAGCSRTRASCTAPCARHAKPAAMMPHAQRLCKVRFAFMHRLSTARVNAN